MSNKDQNHHDLMTQEELLAYLRIPEISSSGDLSNVVDNLRRMRGLPVLHLCRQPMYWKPAVDRWIESQLEKDR